MSTQPIVIKVWCYRDKLQQTATMLSQTTGHRVEFPTEPTTKSNQTYVFVITDIEQYTDEKLASVALGFDIIGKIAGVLSWEVMPKEQLSVQDFLTELSESDRAFLLMLERLPLPIAITQRVDNSFMWKWNSAHGQENTYIAAAQAALTHVMKSYQIVRSELIG